MRLPVGVDFKEFERGNGAFARYLAVGTLLGVVAHEAHKVVYDSGRAARAPRYLFGAALVYWHVQEPASALNYRH